jgi:hypothetical protein
MTEQKGNKIPKPKAATKVEAVRQDVPEAPEGETTGVGAPLEEDPPLTDAERAEAASEVPKPDAPKVELRQPPRFRVTAGGYAWFNGQQIKFTTGEEFTTETWEELLVERFRECGVGIEKL